MSLFAPQMRPLPTLFFHQKPHVEPVAILTQAPPIETRARPIWNTKAGTGGRRLVAIRRRGAYYGQSFADAAYQRPERALLAARAFRDALLDRM